jgi:hypothetical protein
VLFSGYSLEYPVHDTSAKVRHDSASCDLARSRIEVPLMIRAFLDVELPDKPIGNLEVFSYTAWVGTLHEGLGLVLRRTLIAIDDDPCAATWTNSAVGQHSPIVACAVR